MAEPDFIAQSKPDLAPSERAAWLRVEADKARAQGMEWGRATQGLRDIVLLEYWKKRPDDEGAPRFQPVQG